MATKTLDADNPGVTKIERIISLAKFLYVQRVVGFTTPTAPSFDAGTTALFLNEIKGAKNYLEFGSGGSTVAAARAGLDVVSVENDPYYAKAVRSALPSGCMVRFVTPNTGINGPWGVPISHSTAKARRYATAPFKLLRQFPDLILIDGRYRVASALECAREAFTRGAKARLIFDDYIGRKEYHVVERYLGEPQMHGRSALFEIGSKSVPLSAVQSAFSDFR